MSTILLTTVAAPVSGAPVDRTAREVSGRSLREEPRNAIATPTVMMLLDDPFEFIIALRRAVQTCEVLDAKLRIVSTVPENSTRPQIARNVAGIAAALGPMTKVELETREGDAMTVAIARARAERPALIVVRSGFGSKRACRLVDALGIPVVIARDPRPNGAVLGATNMLHPGFPVLTTARDFARRLERPLTLFHNVKPLFIFAAEPMAAASYSNMLHAQEDAAVAKRTRLGAFAGDSEAEMIMARGLDTVNALLDHARHQVADLVVVGHRRRSWFARFLGHRVTERVIERCRRSVLVVPIEESV